MKNQNNADTILSPPTPREKLHNRTVSCDGYRREDGLWDIEGRIIDIKTYGFKNEDRGWIAGGEPLHEMWVRMTCDNQFTIRAIEAKTVFAPFHICPQAEPSMQKLVGLVIGPGFNKELKKRLSGVHGCTHLRELMGPIATTAFQTIMAARYENSPLAQDESSSQAQKDKIKSTLINSCYAFRSDGPIVRKYWPEYAKPADGEVSEER